MTGTDTGAQTTTTTTTETTVDTGTIAEKGSYSMEEVTKNNTPESCWSVIDGVVYNLTARIDQHPGGDKNILKICGIDGSATFDGKHGNDMRAQDVLKGFEIGVLK